MIKIVKEDDFEEKKQRWEEMLKEDNERAEYFRGMGFKVGQKLTLEVEITDEYLSQVLYSLLYNSTAVKGKENLGFKLNMISFMPTNRDGIIRELQELLLKIQNGAV